MEQKGRIDNFYLLSYAAGPAYYVLPPKRVLPFASFLHITITLQ